MGEWPLFSTGLQVVTTVLVAVVVPSVRGIYRELRLLNGRLLTMEERLRGHMELDETRYDDLKAFLHKESLR